MAGLEAVLVIVLVAGAAYALKRAGIFTKQHGDFLAGTFLFYVGLPALVFTSISKVEITANFPLFFFSSVAIVLAMYIVGVIVGNLLKLEKKQRGPFINSVMIMNLGMVAYSFFFLTYGNEGLARTILFDIGNALLIYTLAYYVAVRHGNTNHTRLQSAKKVLTLPLLWAFVIALGFNFAGLALPTALEEAISLIAKATLPLLLITLGIYFEFNVGKNLLPATLAAFLRVFGGLALGLGIATLTGLQGIDKTVVVLGAASPAGYNTIVFAIKEKLDAELAASIVSLSILLSLAVILASSSIP